MKVGVHLPQWGPGACAEGVRDVAQAVEQSGLDSVWVADHLVVPLRSESTYPYRPGGVPFEPSDGFLEAFTTLATVAGVTQRVELGTSVLVLPMRDPLTTAKVVATLDVLSAGRTVLAIGAGWWREEFDALGQRFSARGRRLDEEIEILRTAWTAGVVNSDGEFYRFDPVACMPLPCQTGGPRLLIGGMGAAAHKRAAHRGDGWHAVGTDLDALNAGRQRIERLAAASERDPAEITITTSAGLSPDAERAIARIRGLEEVGVDHLVLNFPGGPAELIERVEWLAESVLPQVRTATPAKAD